MKVILTTKYNENYFWNVNSKPLFKLKDDLIIIEFGREFRINGQEFSTPWEKHVLGGWGQHDIFFVALSKEIDYVINMIADGEDVLVLTDDDPKSLYIFNLLKRKAHKKKFKLHLWGIWPFSFEGKGERLGMQNN